MLLDLSGMFLKLSAHGHALVPRNYKTKVGVSLGHWVFRMRREYEDSNISLKRIQVLNDAGFICEMSYDWLERYEELLQYVAEHGNALVPYRYGYFPGEDGDHRSSGTWVIRQRFKPF
ncbi:hypothetical protein ACHAWO_007532 [Cyclotella atomus]|uniref:Helicase-associated domain-containing protein n=1 Tax=Cyclotella atomus TaxID=382360 RepID=A0ABD3MZR0_9STRA